MSLNFIISVVCFTIFILCPLILKLRYFVIALVFWRKRIISVLLAFSEILVAINQWTIWERSWLIYLFIFLSVKMLVSSAKWRIIEWEIASFRLLIYIRNSKGPSTNPCGTPWVTSILSETGSLTIVCWILFVRCDSNQLSVTPLTPY